MLNEDFLKLDDEQTMSNLLINKMISVDSQDRSGYSILMFATRWQSNKILQLLLENKANPFLPNKFGGTALSIVIGDQNTVLVKRFIQEEKPELCAISNEGEFYRSIANDVSTKDSEFARDVGFNNAAASTCFTEAIRICDILGVNISDFLMTTNHIDQI
jgi:ankyrin repeat protein